MEDYLTSMGWRRDERGWWTHPYDDAPKTMDEALEAEHDDR